MFLVRLIRRVLAWLRRLLMPTKPTPQELYIDGFFFGPDEEPLTGQTITATLVSDDTNRIIDATGNLVTSAGDVPSSAVDGNGWAYWQLHPNNVAGDKPSGTHWVIHEPAGHESIIQIPFDHELGQTTDAAIPYTSLIVQPEDLDPIIGPGLEQRVSDLETGNGTLATLLGLLLDANGDALEAAGKARTLVDAALASSTIATGSAAGLMPPGKFTLLTTFEAGNANDPDTLARQGPNGIIVPRAPRPTSVLPTGNNAEGRLLLNASTGDVEAAVATGTPAANVFSALAPSLDQPWWKTTGDISISQAAWSTIATLPIVTQGTYLCIAPLQYAADPAVDLQLRFAALAGATLTWQTLAISSDNASSGGKGSIDASTATGSNLLTLGGQGVSVRLGAVAIGTLTVSTAIGSFILQAQKSTTGPASTIFTNSAMYLLRFG